MATKKQTADTESISLTDGGMIVADTDGAEKTIGSWYKTAGLFAANLDDGTKAGPFEDQNDLIELIAQRRQDRQEATRTRGFTSAAADPSELEGEEREEALMAQRAAEAGDVRPDGRPERAVNTPSTANVEAAQATAELEGNDGDEKSSSTKSSKKKG